MSTLAFDLDERDDIGFVHQVRPIIAGVLRVIEAREVYVVKIDSWFGEKWLGFSNKLLGAVGVQHRLELRVPPFVPARVISQQFFRREQDGEYVAEDTTFKLHIAQTSEDNARRLMSIVCPSAAVFWWSGDTRASQRGSLMAYLPTSIGVHDADATKAQIARAITRRVWGPHPYAGHVGWHAEFKKVRDWRVAKALCTTVLELSRYADSVAVAN